MSRDSVRYGRVPKRSRETRPESDPQPSAAVTTTVMEQQPNNFEEQVRWGIAREVSRAVIEAYQTTNAVTDEQHRALQTHEVPINAEETDGQEEASSSTDRVPTRITLWNMIGQRMAGEVHQIVEFAKRLPGFYTLPQDDQLILIKLGFFEVWLTKAACLSNEDRLVFDDGSVLHQHQLETAYEDAEFAKSVFEYMWRVRELQLTEEETALLCGLQLMSPARAGLTTADRVDLLYKHMEDALSYYMNACPERKKRAEGITPALAAAQALSVRHGQLLEWCRAHHARLALPPVFAEMFDIPKNEEPKAPPPSLLLPKADSTLLNM